MPKQKIKISDHESDQDDILKPCLQIGSEVKLKDVPTTGEEYLLKVMKERQNYDAVTICKKDFSKYNKNQDRFIYEIPRASVCDKLKPTLEWQNIQVADFSEVRMNVSRLRAQKSEWAYKIKKLIKEPSNVAEWKQFFANSEPTMSCVLGLRNALVDNGLEMLIEILKEVKPGHSIEYRTGQWIYALLACVIQPLLSETTCILRDLSRKCAEIRSNINPDDENAPEAVAPMNIFICLVGRYFRQYDLAD
ncbi:gem-associated protein 2-like [Pectinophora gossypiella]|uniref:Gem-associated protein 2 n=1 Tax=Pectinophora gossypiella TaxID=13191 RepID=A0A1E1WIW2_PECGO|nr:gem-associated protein 2-like [Pectinophora gossypiella]